MYVSKNGKRSENCGSREQPCGNIADALLNRTQKITVYLVSESSAENLNVEQRRKGSHQINQTTETTTSKKPKKNEVTYEYELLLP